MTRPTRSTTGQALTRRSRVATMISLNMAVSPTATTLLVITSLTALFTITALLPVATRMADGTCPARCCLRRPWGSGSELAPDL
jgi:hypothetical protein